MKSRTISHRNKISAMGKTAHTPRMGRLLVTQFTDVRDCCWGQRYHFKAFYPRHLVVFYFFFFFRTGVTKSYLDETSTFRKTRLLTASSSSPQVRNTCPEPSWWTWNLGPWTASDPADWEPSSGPTVLSTVGFSGRFHEEEMGVPLGGPRPAPPLPHGR